MKKHIQDPKILIGAAIIAIGLALMFCSGPATADNAIKQPHHASGYQRAGGAVWGRAVSVAITTSSVDDASGDPILFKWGSLARVTCEGQADFCWTQTEEATMSNGANGGTITDANGANGGGFGSCFRVEAGTGEDNVIWRPAFLSDDSDNAPVGMRSGVCTSDATLSGNTGRPCRVDGDCPGANTCFTGSGAQSAIQGAYLRFISDATTECFVRVDR